MDDPHQQARHQEPMLSKSSYLKYLQCPRYLWLRLIPALTRPDLQNYVDKRSEEWIDPNIYR
jgi:hypothetical protein